MKIYRLIVIFMLASLLIMKNTVKAQFQYPITKKVIQTDDYFGTKVSDPYRWLENDKSDETKEWVKEQNVVTKSLPKIFQL